MKTVKCLPVTVYRPAGFGDCTNGGVSAHNDRLYLECDEGFVDRDPADPTTLRLVETLYAAGLTTVHAESYCGKAAIFADDSGKTVGPMFGGNFVFSSDSRFPTVHPIALHDRYETPEQYDLFSR